MRPVLTLIVLALATTPAIAQNSPPPVYPMPPPAPVIVTTPDGRDVPARFDGFSDRSTRCLQYGQSIGVPRDQIEAYVKRCQLQ